jgi:hypothetical protein
VALLAARRWRRYYFADETYVAEADALQERFATEGAHLQQPARREEEVRYCYKLGGRAGRTRVETIVVIEARLRPFTPVLQH